MGARIAPEGGGAQRRGPPSGKGRGLSREGQGGPSVPGAADQAQGQEGGVSGGAPPGGKWEGPGVDGELSQRGIHSPRSARPLARRTGWAATLRASPAGGILPSWAPAASCFCPRTSARPQPSSRPGPAHPGHRVSPGVRASSPDTGRQPARPACPHSRLQLPRALGTGTHLGTWSRFPPFPEVHEKAPGPGAGWSRALPALYARGRFWPSLSLLAFQGNLVSSFPPEIDPLEGLNSDFHEQPPGGARGAPLAASEAFRVGERGAAGTRRGPPDTAETPPFFRLLLGRASMEPPDALPRPLWSSGTGFPRTKVRTPRPFPHRGQAQTPAAGNQSKRLSGGLVPPTPRRP
ncbi:basic salivary proline-rich protein 2-like [Dama dama]|uniref:basic salivary proline-rich protein 2-like n=1 Tax=Dama dama TaxID=30532 RepID=UPI002A36AA26|nr:basic salivary proline-rich protein 2-like [Dama dama]